MAAGRKTGGRQKGTQNKLTQSAKQAFEYAFDGIGGAKGLEKWARDNRTDFYRLFARLLPTPVELSGGLELKSHVTHDELVGLLLRGPVPSASGK